MRPRWPRTRSHYGVLARVARSRWMPVGLPGRGLDDGDAIRAVAGRNGGRRLEGALVDDRQRVRSLVGHVDRVAGGPYGEWVRAVWPDGDVGGDPMGSCVDGCDPARTEAGDVGPVAVGAHRDA